MRKPVLAAFVSVMLSALPAAAQARKSGAKKPAANPTATVFLAGLRVVGPAHGPENDQKRPFNYDLGTTVVVGVRVAPPFGLVELDKERSRAAFTDAQGQSLGEVDVDWNPDFTKDGTVALVDLDADAVPSAGSTHVSAKGELMFRVATGVKTVKVPGIKLEKGATFRLGTTPITVSNVEEADSEYGPTVIFKGPKAALKAVKTVRARDAKGTEMETRWASTSGWDEEYEIGYRVKTTAKALNFEFDLWDGLRELPVSYSLDAGVAVPR